MIEIFQRMVHHMIGVSTGRLKNTWNNCAIFSNWKSAKLFLSLREKKMD